MTKKPIIKLNKSSNIPLKRRIRLWSERSWLASKILLIIFLYIFFFTAHLNSFKEFLWENFYDISGDMGFALEKVVIKGNKNLKTTDIVSSLNADVGTPLFAINLHDIHDKIKEFSWVDQAIVKRIMPNIIEVDILEREPIAIWQNRSKFALIDAEGAVIASTNIGKFPHLLQVVGRDANFHADSLIESLKTHPEILKSTIAAVRYGQRRWNLLLKDKITVKLPEKNLHLALEYIAKMIRQNKLWDNQYKILDLRDQNKYYIEKY